MPPNSKELAVYSSMVQFERTRPSDRRFEPRLQARSVGCVSAVHVGRVPKPPPSQTCRHGHPTAQEIPPSRSLPQSPKVRRRYYLEDIELHPIDKAHGRTSHLQQAQCTFYDYLADPRTDRIPRMPSIPRAKTHEEATLADPAQLLRWVHSVHPKSRIDAYPLFIIVRDYLRRILQREIDLAVPAIKRLEDDMEELHTKLRKRLAATKEEYELLVARLEKTIQSMRKRARAQKHSEAHALQRQERANTRAMQGLEKSVLDLTQLNEHMTRAAYAQKSTHRSLRMKTLENLQRSNFMIAVITNANATKSSAPDWLTLSSDENTMQDLIENQFNEMEQNIDSVAKYLEAQRMIERKLRKDLELARDFDPSKISHVLQQGDGSAPLMEMFDQICIMSTRDNQMDMLCELCERIGVDIDLRRMKTAMPEPTHSRAAAIFGGGIRSRSHGASARKRGNVAPPVSNQPWTLAQDESGNWVYTNSETGETQNDPPASWKRDSNHPWSLVEDSDGNFVYVNAEIGQSQSGKPAAWNVDENDPWKQVQDRNGNWVYVNTESGEQQKKAPAGFKRDDNHPWVTTTDANGKTIYVNTDSGEQSADRPPGFVVDNGPWMKVMDEDGKWVYTNSDTGETQEEPPVGWQKTDNHPWTMIQDENGKFVYQNTETGEVQATPPADFVKDDNHPWTVAEVNGKLTYVNVETGESSRAPPSGFIKDGNHPWTRVLGANGEYTYFNTETGGSSTSPPLEWDENEGAAHKCRDMACQTEDTSAEGKAGGREKLVVKIDGDTRQVTLCGSMTNAADAAEVLDLSLSGIQCEALNGCIKLTSHTVGKESTVEVVEKLSGPNALAIMGYADSTTVQGQDEPPMSGYYQGGQFVPHDFREKELELTVAKRLQYQQLKIFTKKLPKNTTPIPMRAGQRLIAELFERKVIADSTKDFHDKRDPMCAFFSDFALHMFGLKSIADTKVRQIWKYCRNLQKDFTRFPVQGGYRHGPVLVDTTGDGKFDALGYDVSGDGNMDSVDLNMNGNIDGEIKDTTGDGVPDTIDLKGKKRQINATDVQTEQMESTLPAGLLFDWRMWTFSWMCGLNDPYGFNARHADLVLDLLSLLYEQDLNSISENLGPSASGSNDTAEAMPLSRILECVSAVFEDVYNIKVPKGLLDAIKFSTRYLGNIKNKKGETLCSVDHTLGLVMQAWRAETTVIERKLQIFFDTFDSDGSGNLDLQEFEKLVESILQSRGLEHRTSHEVLKMYDKCLELSDDVGSEDAISLEAFLRMSWEFNLNFGSTSLERRLQSRISSYHDD